MILSSEELRPQLNYRPIKARCAIDAFRMSLSRR